MIRSRRIGLSHLALALFALAILGKAVSVQLVHGREWRRRAAAQQLAARDVPAPRGEILDATHRVLAESHEQVRLEVAPREVKDRPRLRALLRALGVEAKTVARATDTSVNYVTIPGRFLAVDAHDVMLTRGVHSFATITRSYNVSRGAQGILGHVDENNKPVDGLELSLDSLLRGTPGSAMLVRDSRLGRESPMTPGTPPVKGNSVVLTINADLQEIAEKSLADAVARMGAQGGDIVIMDPHTGDILAMASRRLDPRQTSATVITEPFEPGSTMKPFIAAGLLERGRVTDHDSVDTGNGVLVIKGRANPIRDEHLIGRAPLSQVLRWSSNIGIVKFSQRLRASEEYETLRDFGFGVPTGLPFPTESGGTLRSPSSRTWSSQSAISMAMGYEIAVTPLQLAVAYATFANGGQLVEPALIKEIVGPDGAVRYQRQPRMLRRVISAAVADKVRHMLLDVVDEGTALQAAIDNYRLAGKTGTPRRAVHGRYDGTYNPNFASLFPGDNPQYVIVVKLTAPQTSIFAAETAAPVTKAILEAAVAAGNAALDRSKLASSVLPAKKATTVNVRQMAQAVSAPESVTTDTASRSGDVPFVATLPIPKSPLAPRMMKPVPDVRGMVLRDAVRSLQDAGFRVQLARAAVSTVSGSATSPAAGELAPTGTLVRLLFEY